MIVIYILIICFAIEGEYFSISQDVDVSLHNSLPYGMNKEYLDTIRPSGIVRTWMGVITSNVRNDVFHDLTLKVK